MSLFLQEMNCWGQHRESEENLDQGSCQAPPTKADSFSQFDGCITKHLSRHKDFTTTFSSEDNDSKTYGVYIQNISTYFTGLLTIVYNKSSKQVSVYYRFLDRNGQFLKIQGPHMLNQVFKSALLSPSMQDNSIKLFLSSESGSLCLQICYFSFHGSNIIQDMDKRFGAPSKNLIVDIYRSFIAKCIPLFQNVFKSAIPIEGRTTIEEPSRYIDSIIRYSKMMTSKAYLGSVTLQSEEARADKLTQRSESGRRLGQRKVVLTEGMIKPFDLFAVFKEKPEKKRSKNISNEFLISTAEEAQLSSAIALEDHRANLMQMNARMNILNFIKINEPEKMKKYPLNSGGFSFIESAEVIFWYVDSYRRLEESNMNPKNLFRKFLAIKRENRPHGKNVHEYKVISEMRNGVNMLLPKYYIPVNAPAHNLNEDPLLMMELLSDGTLNDFMRSRRNNVSLLAKIKILFSITMGLRYLQTYRIVHLDIKPSNIMMAPDLLVKIIDFGEAYHPIVCKEEGANYRPGFTPPYSPPEIYSRGKMEFTSKSDVYSLGVVMFEVLYGKVPFENRERMFLAPEVSDIYGDPVVIRILNWVISRCLSHNPECRPQLDWVSIILRLSLEEVP